MVDWIGGVGVGIGGLDSVVDWIGEVGVEDGTVVGGTVGDTFAVGFLRTRKNTATPIAEPIMRKIVEAMSIFCFLESAMLGVKVYIITM